ncbi:MAG: FtsQ-type POTRA domain-containing protein [Elusimicrobia bacterium]|nr:FtsQ-type POTRA domain-containing protein [Elusimicrobiota bacterium]
MPASRVSKIKKRNTRIKKRRKQVLYFRDRVRKSALSVGSLVVLLVAGWLGYQKIIAGLTTSPRCALAGIEIKNLKYLSQHEILRLANIPSGANIFSLSVKEIEVRIESNILVKKAQVDRKWPNRLVISVQEREPLVRIIDNRQEYLLDREARLIKNSLKNPISLPLLSGLSRYDTRLPALVKFLLSWQKQGGALFPKISNFTMDAAKGLIVQLSNGLTLYWGELDPNKIAEKISRWQQVQDDLNSKGIPLQYIDLRFKNVVVKPL